VIRYPIKSKNELTEVLIDVVPSLEQDEIPLLDNPTFKSAFDQLKTSIKKADLDPILFRQKTDYRNLFKGHIYTASVHEYTFNPDDRNEDDQRKGDPNKGRDTTHAVGILIPKVEPINPDRKRINRINLVVVGSRESRIAYSPSSRTLFKVR